MKSVSLAVGGARLNRIPYFDIAIDPELIGLDAAQVAQIPWAEPVWADEHGLVRFGQAVWIVESQGVRIAVDPCGATDEFLRTGSSAFEHQESVAHALEHGGFSPDSIDIVWLSHLDGIGMTARVDADGSWSPMFPNARVVIGAEHLAWSRAQPERFDVAAFDALCRDHDVLDAVSFPHSLTNEIELHETGAHAPGHAIAWIRSQAECAVMLGHLAVSPLHIVTGPCTTLHVDAHAAWEVLGAVIGQAQREAAIVIGPLWPNPGAGHVGEDRSLTPVLHEASA